MVNGQVPKIKGKALKNNSNENNIKKGESYLDEIPYLIIVLNLWEYTDG